MPAPPVGLDITPSSLVAVTLKKKGKAYAIDTRSETQLAPGIVADGEVHDADRLPEASREALAYLILNHPVIRNRKLLLHRRQIDKLEREIGTVGAFARRAGPPRRPQAVGAEYRGPEYRGRVSARPSHATRCRGTAGWAGPTSCSETTSRSRRSVKAASRSVATFRTAS